jgi:hypothetical protein
VLAALVLSSERFASIGAALGLPEMKRVDGPIGAWLTLVPLAVLAWILVRVPLPSPRSGSAQA